MPLEGWNEVAPTAGIADAPGMFTLALLFNGISAIPAISPDELIVPNTGVAIVPVVAGAVAVTVAVVDDEGRLSGCIGRRGCCQPGLYWSVLTT